MRRVVYAYQFPDIIEPIICQRTAASVVAFIVVRYLNLLGKLCARHIVTTFLIIHNYRQRTFFRHSPETAGCYALKPDLSYRGGVIWNTNDSCPASIPTLNKNKASEIIFAAIPIMWRAAKPKIK